MKTSIWFVRIVVVCIVLSARLATAATHKLADSIVQEALSDAVPFVFSPINFTTRDYVVKWTNTPIVDVELSLEEGSLDWVRVSDVILVPRARLIIRAKNAEAGKIFNGGFTQSLAKDRDGWSRAEVPVALVSGTGNAIEINLQRNGAELRGRAVFEFVPETRAHHSRMLFDTSCSRFNLTVASGAIPANSWAYVGCRLVYMRNARNFTSSLEIFVFWDNVGQVVSVDGVSVAAASPSVWAFRQRSFPGAISLHAPQSQDSGGAVLKYFVPDELHFSFLGMGVGPYAYSFYSQYDGVETWAPLVTLYGAFFVNDEMRFVFFDATSIHSRFFTDFGLYFSFEQVRAIDRRISVNLLLGAHAIAFRHGDRTPLIIGGPQGIEAIIRDFIVRRYNFSMGAFVYPLINDSSYYNIWFRWGTSGLFAEINFIAWQELYRSDQVSSRSLGLTVGMPLLQLF